MAANHEIMTNINGLSESEAKMHLFALVTEKEGYLSTIASLKQAADVVYSEFEQFQFRELYLQYLVNPNRQNVNHPEMPDMIGQRSVTCSFDVQMLCLTKVCLVSDFCKPVLLSSL